MHCVGTAQTFSVRPGDSCWLITCKLKGLKSLLRISIKNLLILALNLQTDEKSRHGRPFRK